MSEMLANQYFLSRKYNLSARELELSIRTLTDNKLLIKKLIICYTQINKPEKALELFLNLIKSDIEIIINTEKGSDDCPCFELIDRIIFEEVRYQDEYTKSYVLGILYLYCDTGKSLKYFKLADSINPGQSKIISVIGILNQRINQINKQSI